MKQIFSIFLAVGAFLPAQRVAAQSCPCTAPLVQVAKITYTYDGAGNRIKRQSTCFCVAAMTPPANNNNSTARLASPADSLAYANANSIGNTEGTSGNTSATIAAVSPNPTSSLLNITFSSAIQTGMLIVSDGTGKAVAEYKVSGTTYSLDMSALPSGMYYCTLRNEGSTNTHKVVKIE